MTERISPQREFWSAVRDILPLAAGVFIYGLAFGLLAAQAGLTSLQVGVMGGIVFAGGSQIVAVERLVAGAGATAALVAGIALNLRLILVAASIRDVYAGRPIWQLLLGAHMTTDENWALLLSERAKGRDLGYWYLVGGGACLLVVWVAATVTGILFATQIPEPRALGMDFAFTAAFIAIARSLWRGRHDLVPWVASALVVAVSLASGRIDPSWALVLGGVAGAVVAGVMREGLPDA
jgi:4-azaleucine resistance transporter AzlC